MRVVAVLSIAWRVVLIVVALVTFAAGFPLLSRGGGGLAQPGSRVERSKVRHAPAVAFKSQSW